MREIKFRAWDGEKIAAPDYMTYETDTGEAVACWDDHDHARSECPFTSKEIMQYTGLKDSKGTEIYEGDIVKDYEFGIDVEVSVVVFDKDQARFWLEAWGEGLDDIRDAVVIGNIYKNPELLPPSID